MKKIYTSLSLLYLLFTISTSSYATVFTSISGGDWNDAGTWNVGNGKTPGSLDDVIILHDIFISGKDTVQSLSISNSANQLARLIIQGTDTLTVLGNLTVTAENHDKNVQLQLISSSKLIVKGNATFTRSLDNNSNNMLQFSISGDANVFILGQFNFEYKNSDYFELNPEIITSGNAILDVAGETQLITNGGNDLDLKLEGNSQVIFRDSLSMLLTGGQEVTITSNENSHFQLLASGYLHNSGGTGGYLDHCKIVTSDDNTGGQVSIMGDLYLESSGTGNNVKIEVSSKESTFSLRGNLIMNAENEEDVTVTIENNGKFYLGGNIIRQTDFGALRMASDGELIFNGSTAQSMPASQLGSATQDSLEFEKISFANTSGSPIVLTQNLIVKDTLFMTAGKIQTSDAALLILADGAVISGGDASTYIIGPVQKNGTADSLFFPIGTASKYAPLQVSEITDVNSEMTVTYYTDPPPFGGVYNYNLSEDLENISLIQHWTVVRTSSVDQLDFTLHWMNDVENGINDTSGIVVAGLTGTTYESYGREKATSVGSTGSVTSAFTDPPPFGTEYLTIGSTKSSSSLPVELTKFQAIQKSQEVYLQWETASEIKTSHFEVQHSTDGINFKTIQTVIAEGNSTTNQYYSAFDKLPEDGMNYYRLRIVDLDGTEEFSAIEVVYFDTESTFNIFPNPVEKVITIEGVNNFDGNVSLKVFDKTGQMIFSDYIEFDNGIFQISTDQINVKSEGTYFIQIISNTESKVLKFIKLD